MQYITARIAVTNLVRDSRGKKYIYVMSGGDDCIWGEGIDPKHQLFLVEK